MKKSANLKSTIEQLKALQTQAKSKLEKISGDASGKPHKRRKIVFKRPGVKRNTKPSAARKIKPVTKAKPEGITRVKPRVKKIILLTKIYRRKTRTVRRRIPRNRRIR